MAINSALARVGVTGAAFVAPISTTLPTGLAVPAGTYTDLGAISDEGLTETRSEDRQEWTPWQSTSPIRTEITSATKTFQITCWESKKETISLYYQVPVADMVEATGVVSFDEPARPEQDVRLWLFDVFDGANQRRFICPRAEVTERGDIVYASAEMIGYQMTITAYPGADGYSIRRLFAEGWVLT